jgi:hypothetical protein
MIINRIANLKRVIKSTFCDAMTVYNLTGISCKENLLGLPFPGMGPQPYLSMPFYPRPSSLNPSMTYLSWSLTKKQKNKLVTTEMRCLRKAAGVTRRDRIRNDVIRERLGIEPILKYIQKQKIKWFAHLERMPCDSIPY